jgi:hypothetical protein
MKILVILCTLTLLNSYTNFAVAQETNSTSKPQLQDIVYTAKFVCGSIPDDNGPLRPGHYDTSINIFNKKSYRIGILITAVINDGPSSIAIFRNVEPEMSTALSCQNIKDMFGIDTNEIVEGFTIIKVPIVSLRGFNNEQIIPDLSQDRIDVLDVQVFYTANTLSTLPHEITREKISFYIIQDGTGKIPKESFRKLLDVTIPSKFNEVEDTEQKIKSILATKYQLTEKELEEIRIRVKSISIGVGVLLDDHAVSLHVVKPQLAQ